MNKKVKVGLGVTMFGLTYIIGALGLPRSPVGDPFAPIVYPLLLGILLTGCGAIQLVIGIIKQSKEEKQPAKKFEATPVFKLIVISVFAAIGYALVFSGLGYVISTFLFLGTILFSLNGKDKWKTNILVAIIFSISVYFLFSNILAIPLPRIPILDI
ncbi:tripartite tricarboxylate transporter TctB family protein [Cellulosilyticum sp. I15G10I2]|uniref:tripartite tricarboxylate transporter TctB family protein n=1 Tax=Cellulosilyticum sp. I15G10I2 TaxID=1892843 RepID=UPI00085BBA12|nr:tripartite tricarboxylate transporter TctB family protein [Cellulosilyticum sp. I15G10I2]